MSQQEDFQRLYQLLGNQDRVMGQLQNLLTEYQRNHAEMVVLHQKLRTPIQSKIPDGIRLNKLYNISNESIIEGVSLVNPSSSLLGYYLKFDEYYNDLIGGQDLWEFEKILVLVDGDITAYRFIDEPPMFNNYDLDVEDKDISDSFIVESLSTCSRVKQLTIKLIEIVDSQLRVVMYKAEPNVLDVEILGFCVKESKKV